ncbi:MAG TPA: methyltransferase [Candidatus Hydrogenedentes bacterium]|nr:methyltransferase [Candidatus Hydrogenedentota bacterium]HIJ73021.1 methyltransferase [Candidatus Hydrogenedentota bacterium]
MTSRERVIRTLNFDNPDRAPHDLWALPRVTAHRRAEVDELLARFPGDFASPEFRYGASSRARGAEGEVGRYTDAWGSEWTVGEPGVVGEVKNPPLADWRALESWTPPWELLDHADFSKVDASCAETDKFVKPGTEVRPFERMQFLRGTENLFMDLALQPPEFLRLRDMIHEFNVREMELWAQTAVDGVSFMDDWGTQQALLVSPDLWRALFKPMYREYCSILREAGKYVFFHSDGHIAAIYADLIEIGIHAVNSQLFCMDIEELARQYKGKVTFWGEIDRQRLLPFGTVDEVREGVRRVRRALDNGAGGVIAQCEWGIRDPKENIAAVFETWLEAR